MGSHREGDTLTLFAGIAEMLLVLAALLAAVAFTCALAVLAGGEIFPDAKDFQLEPRERTLLFRAIWASPLFVLIASLVVEWLHPMGFWAAGS